MRIALVTTSWPIRSSDPSGHFIQAEARLLEREGHEVFVIAPAFGGAFGWPGVAARIRQHPSRAVSAAWWVTVAHHRLKRIPAIDLTVAHWAVPSAWPIGMAARGPLEVVSHGGDVRLLVALPSALRERVTKTIARRARQWRFASENLMSDLLLAVQPRTRELVQHIAIVKPVELDMPDVTGDITRLRAKLANLCVAVCVARLVPSKHVERAIRYVASTREFDQLVIVGDGPERAHLEDLVRRLGVTVQFVGVVDRLQALAWIGAASALIHASDSEGASTVVREARELGTRVVTLGTDRHGPTRHADFG